MVGDRRYDTQRQVACDRYCLQLTFIIYPDALPGVELELVCAVCQLQGRNHQVCLVVRFGSNLQNVHQGELFRSAGNVDVGSVDFPLFPVTFGTIIPTPQSIILNLDLPGADDVRAVELCQ